MSANEKDLISALDDDGKYKFVSVDKIRDCLQKYSGKKKLNTSTAVKILKETSTSIQSTLNLIYDFIGSKSL